MADLMKFCIWAVVSMLVGSVVIHLTFSSLEHFLLTKNRLAETEVIMDGNIQPVTHESYKTLSPLGFKIKSTRTGSLLVLSGILAMICGGGYGWVQSLSINRIGINSEKPAVRE